MPFVLVRDILIYYEIRGSGPRVLGIGGTGGDLRRPPTVFDLSVSRYFRILGYDQRGLGRTSRPDFPYAMADYAEDAAGLLDVLGWDRCAVLGVSFGGMVAQELALRHPERVERLVLACTTSGGEGGASYPLHELARLPAEEYVRRFLQLSDTRRDEAWQAEHRTEFQALVDETIKVLRVGAGEPGREGGARRQMEARMSHDTYDRLDDLKMPVYVCGGRYDGIATPGSLEAMHKKIPGSRLELFEGGHLFFFQDPHACERITAFMKNELRD